MASVAPAVTPIPGVSASIAVGATSQVAVGPNPNGGFITNPAGATESLFVNPVAAALLTAGGTTFELRPGQSWDIIPGQTTATNVNAVTTGHVFSVVSY